MAKDPAFLFYPGDWQGGTLTFSRFLKGCYMDLLIAQFNTGPLSLKQVKAVLGTDFKKAWPEVSKKFKTDANDNFYNSRMADELVKRTTHSQKQKERIDKYWKDKKALLSDTTDYTTVYTKPDTKGHTKHIPLEDESENILSTGKRGEGGKPSRDQFLQDLPNSEEFEVIRGDHGLTREYLLILAAEFKTKAAAPSYKKFERLAEHFGNWVRLNKAAAITPTAYKSPKPYK